MDKQKYLSLLGLCFIFSFYIFSQSFSRDLRNSNPRLNGPDVMQFQEALISLGFSSFVSADGWFGPKTEIVVKHIQNFLEMNQNGVVNKILFEAIAIHSMNPLMEEYLKLVSQIYDIDTSSLQSIEKQVMGYSSEGGVLSIYHINDLITYYILCLCGEMGKVISYCYSFSDNTYLVKEMQYSYPEQFDIDHAIISTSSYFYTPSYSFEISNCNFSSIEYDSKKILSIINDHK